MKHLTHPLIGLLAGTLAVSLLLGAPPTTAATHRTGPALDVPAKALADSLACSSTVDGRPPADPVLLVPGTTLTASVNYSWNYELALKEANIPWCAVTVPNHGMTDIQVAAAYIVNGIRHLHSVTGRKVRIVGYSQGGMSPRWALKYWPGTRAMVSELIAIDPSNHGTADAAPLCSATCAPSIRQQAAGSRFLTTLNRGGETFAGIDYTVVYTLTDEVVTPNVGPSASSPLHTGKGDISNISVQSICPADIADHLTMGSTDPVGWAVVYDALMHPGPAKASRINRGVCLQGVMASIELSRLPNHEKTFLSQVALSLLTSPMTAAEPALKAYAL